MICPGCKTDLAGGFIYDHFLAEYGGDEERAPASISASRLVAHAWAWAFVGKVADSLIPSVRRMIRARHAPERYSKVATLGIRLGISLGGAYPRGHRDVFFEANVYGGESAITARLHDFVEVGFEEGEEDLGFGVAKAAVEFEDGGAVGC